MKNKTVKLVASLTALGVLTGGYFGVKTYVQKQETAEAKAEEEETYPVLSGNMDELKSVKFTIDKEEKTFVKEGDAWVIQKETEFPLDQDKLTSAFGAFQSTEAERKLTEVENLEEYGLDQPLNTIVFATEDGEETAVHIGMKNESTGQYYVNLNEEKDVVYLVSAATFDPFMNSLYDYAKKDQFPDVDSSKIQKVKVEKTDGFLELNKEEDTGFWNVSDGKDTEKADSAKASSFTSSVSSLEYDSFADYNCTDFSVYGLENPYATVTVDYQEEEKTEEPETDTETEDASEETENQSEDADAAEEEPVMIDKKLVLTIGNEAEDESRYVRINDSSQIYTISQELLSAFVDKNVEDFWDLTVSYVSVNELNTLMVETSDGKHEINVSRETSKNEDGEEQEEIKYSLDGKELEETLFTTFYNKLINMVGQKRLTEPYTPTGDPEITAVFQKEEGTQVKVQYFGYDTNFYAAQVDDKVFLVNKMSVKEMISAYEEMFEVKE